MEKEKQHLSHQGSLFSATSSMMSFITMQQHGMTASRFYLPLNSAVDG
jgi:hypothetical protein